MSHPFTSSTSPDVSIASDAAIPSMIIPVGAPMRREDWPT
jgi:hypothetical protein